MEFSRLAGKTAADKNSDKLGKIIQIENLPGKTIKKLKPHAIVLVRRMFKSDVVIPLDIDLLIKDEGYYAWFDVLKEDFDKDVKQQRAVKGVRETYGKFVDAPGNIKYPMKLPRNRRKE